MSLFEPKVQVVSVTPSCRLMRGAGGGKHTETLLFENWLLPRNSRNLWGLPTGCCPGGRIPWEHWGDSANISVGWSLECNLDSIYLITSSFSRTGAVPCLSAELTCPTPNTVIAHSVSALLTTWPWAIHWPLQGWIRTDLQATVPTNQLRFLQSETLK